MAGNVFRFGATAYVGKDAFIGIGRIEGRLLVLFYTHMAQPTWNAYVPLAAHQVCVAVMLLDDTGDVLGTFRDPVAINELSNTESASFQTLVLCQAITRIPATRLRTHLRRVFMAAVRMPTFIVDSTDS